MGIMITYSQTLTSWIRQTVSQYLFILLLGSCCLPLAAQTNANFQTQTGIPCIPVLSTAPSASAAGAIYINSTTKIGYRYTGAVWIPICVNPGEIVSPTGRVWMDRNLGAKRVATSSTDYLAYGDLFQWCRAADGHEKINWTSSTTGTAVNGTTATLSTTATPGHSLFITNSTSPYDWISTSLSDETPWLYATIVGGNNPCPAGFHVPTNEEWTAEQAYITDATTAYTHLKLTAAGARSYTNGIVNGAGTGGRYWTSTFVGVNSNSKRLLFENSSSSSNMGSSVKAMGESIRCIKDQ